MRGPEGKIQDAVVKFAREEYDCLCRKNEAGPYHNGGFLDYTFYPNRRPVFVIEFKAPGEEMTPKQQFFYDELKKRGQPVYMVDDEEKGKKIITKHCKEKTR